MEGVIATMPTLEGLNKLLCAPFRDEMVETIILRGLAPTAIHIIPLQGNLSDIAGLPALPIEYGITE